MQHQRQGRGGSASLIRVAGMSLVLVLLLISGIKWMKTLDRSHVAWRPVAPEDRFFLPRTEAAGTVRHTDFFSLGYSGGSQVPVWAACEWDARMGDKHLPSYFDSNYFQMSLPLFSKWQELGSRGEDAARRLGRVYSVSGPVRPGMATHFFVVWLDEGFQKIEAVGLLLGNDLPENGFTPAVVTIDSIESLTGLDLFPDLLTDSLENEVEKNVYTAHWEPEISFNTYFVPGKK